MREKNIAVTNIGLDFRCVDSVILKNVSVEGQAGEPYLFEKVGKISIN